MLNIRMKRLRYDVEPERRAKCEGKEKKSQIGQKRKRGRKLQRKRKSVCKRKEKGISKHGIQL